MIINWNKIFFLTGEPLQCRQTELLFLRDYGAESNLRFDKDDSITKIINAIIEFNLFGNNHAVIVSNPKAEMLKSIWEAINKQAIACPCIIFKSTDGFDGRNAFVQAANKNKSLYDFDYVEEGNLHGISDCLNEWVENTTLPLSSSVKKYIIDNAPVYVAKIKGYSGKKDAQVYDFETINNELDKLIPIKILDKSPITIEDIQEFCVFSQTVDPWEFVRQILSGSAQSTLALLEQTQDVSSVLWLLASQVGFLIELSSCSNLATGIADKIATEMSISDRVGVYFLPDWVEPCEIEVPPVNVWRVKKAIESSNLWKNKNLSNRYQSIFAAIQDLRNNLPKEIVFPMLALAMEGSVDYSSPLKPMKM